MRTQNESIKSFVERLAKLNIKVELAGNYPWIYLDRVNGNKVKDRYAGNHGFTIAFTPIRNDQTFKFTDIGEIFKQIRKMIEENKIPEFKSIDSFHITGRGQMYTIINDKDRKAGSGGRCELTGMEIILDGKKGKIIGAEFFCTAYPMHYAGQPSCILFKEDEVQV